MINKIKSIRKLHLGVDEKMLWYAKINSVVLDVFQNRTNGRNFQAIRDKSMIIPINPNERSKPVMVKKWSFVRIIEMNRRSLVCLSPSFSNISVHQKSGSHLRESSGGFLLDRRICHCRE
jgi:hypothetical protein